MSRSKCRQIPCPVRTHFLAINGHLLAVSSHGGRDEGALWGLFDKSANPICGGSTLVNRSAPRGRSAITLGGVGFSIRIWGRDTLSLEKSPCLFRCRGMNGVCSRKSQGALSPLLLVSLLPFHTLGESLMQAPYPNVPSVPCWAPACQERGADHPGPAPSASHTSPSPFPPTR